MTCTHLMSAAEPYILIDWLHYFQPKNPRCSRHHGRAGLGTSVGEYIQCVTSQHPEVMLFKKKPTVIQKDKGHLSFSSRCFFHLIRGFQKHTKVSTYLIKEHLEKFDFFRACRKKVSQHFEKLVTLSKSNTFKLLQTGKSGLTRQLVYTPGLVSCTRLKLERNHSLSYGKEHLMMELETILFIMAPI